MGVGSSGLISILAALVLSLYGCAEEQQREPPPLASAGESGPGEILYLTYCQSCHGTSGRGDGPAAPSLRTPPPDLTRLWQRYGTPLDRQRLTAYIDGRRLLSAHGSREMPIWGSEFFDDAPPGTPELVEGARERLIDVLVEYLESLQTERRL